MTGTGKIVVIIGCSVKSIPELQERHADGVAGANRGIGLGLATAFRSRDYTVWGSVRPQSKNDASVEDVRDT